MTQARPAAVVIGAGIGGLAAAAGLRAGGWDVTVCERAAAVEPAGAGLGLGPNGLRALDALGAAQAADAERRSGEDTASRPRSRIPPAARSRMIASIDSKEGRWVRCRR
jgi:2-polyprenyl-6-methoxyphenol hydroxylase-like FAD-dependent oxidoreductase